MEDPPDALAFQEVGGFSDLPQGEWRTEAITFSGVVYRTFVFQTPSSHRCTALLFRQDLSLEVNQRHVFGTGFIIQGKSLGRTFWIGCGHLPHQQRPDAEDVWLSSIARIDEILSSARIQDVVLLGLDVNQNLLHAKPSFPALSRIHLLLRYRGLEFNSACGDTWEARGESSCIDWILFRWPVVEVAFHLRADLRKALPSDHNPLFGIFSGRLGLSHRAPRPKHGCGLWATSPKPLELAACDPSFQLTQETFAKLCKENSYRLPSMRYKDPPSALELIRLRKIAGDPDTRFRLAAEVVQARTLAQKQHKLDLLAAARQGDRGAIGHLRRSSLQSHSDGSLIERLGGEAAAVEAFKTFYSKKYSRPAPEAPVSPAQTEALTSKHSISVSSQITEEEIAEALAKVKPSTASGLDSVCYGAIRTFHAQDASGKLCAFFNRILSGDMPVPQEWVTGKICFIPKTARPEKVQDMRPISLTPCLGKVFCKILVSRLRMKFPPYGAGQHACRPGTQVIEPIACALSSMKLFKQHTGRQLLLCKLDISQAFDTLSHHAIWRFLYDTDASPEALALWAMCRETRVCLQLGSQMWTQGLERGVLQGTSFSADLFSRILDYFCTGLIERWQQAQHSVFQKFSLPHALLFADDILLFAATEAEMQSKLHALQLTLESIGLRLNLAKCSVLDQEDGTTPGIWGRHSCVPLQGVDHLVYLGVPLSYKATPLGQLGLSLSKLSSAFFGLRRLFDHPDTPVCEKLLLFQTYITSKWTWCCPVIFLSRKALRSLESFKHTLLLSLLKLQSDPLQGFVVNTISRRRAVKVLCEVHRSARWGELWLQRLWNFWGHILRHRVNLPLQTLLGMCSSWRVLSGRTAASDLLFFIPRRLQIFWNQVRDRSPFPDVESLSQDREAWSQVLPLWLSKWGYGGSELDRLPPNYLHDRQLLLVGKTLAILRPARVFPEEPYSRELQHVQRGQPRPTQWTLWCRLSEDGCCLSLMPPKQRDRQALYLQAYCPTQDVTTRKLNFWEALHALWKWIPELQDNRTVVFLPSQAFAAHIFAHQVPLSSLSQTQCVDRCEVEIDFLSYCFLQPKQTPPWLERELPAVFGPFPGSFRFLIRRADFSDAKYFENLPVLL